MDEASSYVRLDRPSATRPGRPKDSSAPSSKPMMERPCADSEEKHEPASDIDTVVVDSLKALDPNRPIREADIGKPVGSPSRRALGAQIDHAIGTLGIYTWIVSLPS